MLFLDNFLNSGAVVGDDADEVYAIRKVAHINNTGVLAANYCAAIDVDNINLGNLFADIELVVDGVRIEVHIGAVHVVDTRSVTGSNLDIVDKQPVHVGDIVVTESNTDVTGSGDIAAVLNPSLGSLWTTVEN